MSAKMPVSLWDQSALEKDHQSEFSGESEVEVAIVGGGFTGLSAAIHCAQRGLNTHVFEAEKIGFGGSGRNVGLVNAGIWLPPKGVLEHLGPDYGPRFLKLFGDGPETVFSVIEKYQIRCEATREGTIHAAHGPSGLKDLRSRHEEWQRLGEPVDLLSKEETATYVGSDRFHGGLLDHRAGTVNPMAYCRGLARAALAEGAKISTGVRVSKLEKNKGEWTVEFAQGRVQAKSVILATNAYTDELWPGLNRIFTRIHYFQLATNPLGAEANSILPQRQGLWDTGQIMFNIRRDANDRLLVGSMGKIHGDHKSGLTQRWARKQIGKIFPELGEVEFESAWHGQIAMTPDHLPRIYELDEGLFTSIGYNGRGITTGTLFGQTLCDLLTGMDRRKLPLPITEMKAAPFSAIKSGAFQLAFTANQVLKSL